MNKKINITLKLKITNSAKAFFTLKVPALKHQPKDLDKETWLKMLEAKRIVLLDNITQMTGFIPAQGANEPTTGLAATTNYNCLFLPPDLQLNTEYPVFLKGFCSFTGIEHIGFIYNRKTINKFCVVFERTITLEFGYSNNNHLICQWKTL